MKPESDVVASAFSTFPASLAQRRLWFLHQYAPESPVYHIALAQRLVGPLHRLALAQAGQFLVDRHEALRSTFALENGDVVQRIHSAARVTWSTEDLGSHPAASRPAMLGARLDKESRRPFDLETGPLLRMHLFQLHRQEHVLLVVVHHIVFDGWSVNVFYRELAAAYEQFSTGQAPLLPELPIQYADYAVWQRDWLQGERLEQQRAYWKAKLADAPPALDLPTDFPRPSVESFRGEVECGQVERAVVDGLDAAARCQGATLFILALSAFKLLLHRHTGQNDIVVGCPLAGRTREEVEGLIGFFVNTLPLRSDLSGDPGFGELLQRVRRTVLEAHEHSDLPFDQLVEALQVTRDTSRSPLFQVAFIWQNEGEGELRLPGLEAERLAPSTGTSPFDLTLFVQPRAAGLALRLEYSTDLFHAATIRRFLGRFAVVLQGLAKRPEAQISQIPWLEESELHQVLVDWNQTATAYPRERCIHELFQEQVTKTPDAIALSWAGQHLSYYDLNERSNQLAHHLRAGGVGDEAVVALCLERSLDVIVALLAILKAGGAYLALDPSAPEDRLRAILEDAQPKVILCHRPWKEVIAHALSRATPAPAELNPTLCCMEDLGETLRRFSGGNPEIVARPEQLAYICFTSGSTGRPKGVCVPHRGVVRLVRNTNYISIGPSDIFLQLAPLAFDASTFEIWGSLLNGARLVVFPQARFSLSELGTFVREAGISVIWLTAGLFHQMVDDQMESLKGLRVLLSGGDVLSVTHVRKALMSLGSTLLVNGYGPTENTTFTCCHPITLASTEGRSIPIGRPIANTQCYILDRYLQPLPPGLAGELCTGGDGLALGYLNDPALTAARFLFAPFKEGAMLYRTGDLARYASDGTIEFIGRNDFQVKIRGFRIELQEIEAVLKQHPAVRESVVIARADPSGDRSLAAYVAAASAQDSLKRELRQWLKSKLPEYMIPSAFVLLKELPLSSTGKVDRRRLPAMEADAPEPIEPPLANIDPVEVELRRIWQWLFKRTNIRREDNFFELGGHSLLAAKMVAEVERLMNCRVSLPAFFQTPSLGALAQMIKCGNWHPPPGSLVPLQVKGSSPPFFFVHGWGGDVYCFIDLARQLAPDQPVYGLQAVGWDGQENRHTKVEDMAAHYLRELRTFQPTGPYYLGGYCLGGWIAYEVAQQLVRQGQTVGILALLDCVPLGPVHWTVRAQMLAAGSHLPGRTRRQELRAELGRLRRFLRQQARLCLPGPVPIRTLPAVTPGDDYYRIVAATYSPSPYSGSVDLFLSEEVDRAKLDVWRYLARGGVNCHDVPGSHDEMIDLHHAETFAPIFKTVLRDAQNRQKP